MGCDTDRKHKLASLCVRFQWNMTPYFSFLLSSVFYLTKKYRYSVLLCVQAACCCVNNVCYPCAALCTNIMLLCVQATCYCGHQGRHLCGTSGSGGGTVLLCEQTVYVAPCANRMLLCVQAMCYCAHQVRHLCGSRGSGGQHQWHRRHLRCRQS